MLEHFFFLVSIYGMLVGNTVFFYTINKVYDVHVLFVINLYSC